MGKACKGIEEIVGSFPGVPVVFKHLNPSREERREIKRHKKRGPYKKRRPK